MERKKLKVEIRGPTDHPDLLERHWRLSSPNPQRSIIGLADNGDAVASLRLYGISLRADHAMISCWGIGCVFVHPDSRGSGLGTAFLEDAITLITNTRDVHKDPRLGLLLYSRDRTLYRDAGFIPIRTGPKEHLWFRSIQPGLNLYRQPDWHTPGVEHF